MKKWVLGFIQGPGFLQLGIMNTRHGRVKLLEERSWSDGISHISWRAMRERPKAEESVMWWNERCHDDNWVSKLGAMSLNYEQSGLMHKDEIEGRKGSLERKKLRDPSIGWLVRRAQKSPWMMTRLQKQRQVMIRIGSSMSNDWVVGRQQQEGEIREWWKRNS